MPRNGTSRKRKQEKTEKTPEKIPKKEEQITTDKQESTSEETEIRKPSKEEEETPKTVGSILAANEILDNFAYAAEQMTQNLFPEQSLELLKGSKSSSPAFFNHSFSVRQLEIPPVISTTTSTTTTTVSSNELTKKDFINAIKNDNVLDVEKYILQKEDIDFIDDEEDLRPIELAATSHYANNKNNEGKNIFEILLENLKLRSSGSFDINRRNKIGTTLLHFAALSGRRTRVEYLIKNENANPYLKDVRGYTLLHYAIFSQTVNLIDYLIKSEYLTFFLQPENIISSPQKMHLMHFTAAKCTSSEVIIALKDIKGLENPDVFLDKNGETPLHYATAANSTLVIIKHFANDQDSYLKSSNEGVTPLHNLAFRGMLKYFESTISTITSQTLKNLKDHQHQGLTHYAARGGQMDVLSFLLNKYQFSLNEIDANSNTPAKLAREAGYSELAESIEDYTKNLNNETEAETEADVQLQNNQRR